MQQIEKTLLENHLTFLATHRGSVHHGDNDIIYINSDRTEFTYALLGKNTNIEDLESDTKTIQHFPWSKITKTQLQRAGFEPTISLSYMVLGESFPPWRVRRDLTIEKVNQPDHMDIFSYVQSKGFNETQESFDHWHPWLKLANDRNLKNPKQQFYIGSLNAEPAGTVLSVFEDMICGIYAVATIAEHRKKGISTTIMNEAIRDAKSRGTNIITLQVKRDSYVEDFYRHLGFQRIFTTDMYCRK